MRCEDVQDLIDALAAGDMTPDVEVTAHLQACTRCSTGLTRARQIDQALRAMPLPQVPDAFTATLLARGRSIRWKSEQRFDWWFNLAMATAFGSIAAGIWALLHLTGLAAVTVGTANFIGRSVPDLFEQAKPEITLYLTATALVAGALGVWWWFERTGNDHQAA